MPDQMNRRAPLAGITALRFLAATYVILFHTRGGVWFRGGYTAVNLFFVLSGFILAYNYPDMKTVGLKRFYVSRMARIYPLYLFAFAVSLPLFLLTQSPRLVGFDLRACVLHVLMLQTWVPPYRWAINAGSWTMPVEMFFYLLFPLAVGWLGRRQKRWLTTLALLYVALVVPSLLADLIWRPMHPQSTLLIYQIFSLPIWHLGEFLIGIVLGLRFLRQKPVFSGWMVLAAATYCVVALAAVGPLKNQYNEIALNGTLAIPFGLLIYTVAGWKSRIMEHPALQLGGEISYSMYLLQGPFNWFIQTTFHHSRKYAALRFGLLLVLAYITYRLIERPGRQLVLKMFGVKSHPKPIETPVRKLP